MKHRWYVRRTSCGSKKTAIIAVLIALVLLCLAAAPAPVFAETGNITQAEMADVAPNDVEEQAEIVLTDLADATGAMDNEAAGAMDPEEAGAIDPEEKGEIDPEATEGIDADQTPEVTRDPNATPVPTYNGNVIKFEVPEGEGKNNTSSAGGVIMIVIIGLAALSVLSGIVEMIVKHFKNRDKNYKTD